MPFPEKNDKEQVRAPMWSWHPRIGNSRFIPDSHPFLDLNKSERKKDKDQLGKRITFLWNCHGVSPQKWTCAQALRIIYLFVLPTDTHRNRIIIYSRRSPSGTNSVVAGNKPIMVSSKVYHQWVLLHTWCSNVITDCSSCL